MVNTQVGTFAFLEKVFSSILWSTLGTVRVEICRDRHDRRLCKIYASCLNFPGKQCHFSQNLRRSTRFTHKLWFCTETVTLLHTQLKSNKKLLEQLISMHLRCFFFSNFAFAIEALLVCKIFGPKMCKFYDKSQVWAQSLLLFWSFLKLWSTIRAVALFFLNMVVELWSTYDWKGLLRVEKLLWKYTFHQIQAYKNPSWGQHMEWPFCFSGKRVLKVYGTVQFWWTLYPHWKQWKQHGRSPDWCFIIPHDGETFFVTRFIARCLYSRWRLLSNSRHILECHSYIFIYFLPYLNVRWMFFCIILNFFGIFKGNFGNPWKLLVTDGNSIARSW